MCTGKHAVRKIDEEDSELEETDTAMLIKESNDMEQSVKGLQDQIRQLQDEIVSRRDEDEKTQKLFVELRNDVRRIQEATLECVQLARLGQRVVTPA